MRLACAQGRLLKSTCTDGSELAAQLCEEWGDTQSPIAPPGSAAARLAVGLASVGPNGEEVFTEVLELPQPLISSSVSSMPLNLLVRVLDANNATITSGTADASARVAATTQPTSDFWGVPNVDATLGQASFRRLSVKGKPGTYAIMFGEEEIGLSSNCGQLACWCIAESRCWPARCQSQRLRACQGD
jgi:hypothetical protein